MNLMEKINENIKRGIRSWLNVSPAKYRAKEKEWSQETEDRYKVPDEVKVPRSDTPQIMIDLMDQYTRDECIKIDELSEYAFSYDLDNDLIIINPRHPQYEEENYKHVLAHEIA